MASAVIGALRVDLDLGAGGWTDGLAKAEVQAKQSVARFAAIGGHMSQMGAGMQASITAPLMNLARQAVPAAMEAREAMAQVEAALKSMGPAAGFSSAQLGDMAGELMKLSTFDDDEILRKVTANLLTFGNVAGEQFSRAQRAAVDLAARMGTDLQGATLMIGKALNDPAKGLAALRRVGIQFTEQQADQIKKMAAVGDAAGAQAIMLSELERQFGGSAKAMRDAAPGQDWVNAWDDFQETVGEAIVKVLPALEVALSGIVNAFNVMPEGGQVAVIILGAIAAAAGPLLTILGPLIAGFGALQATLLTSAAAAGGWSAMLLPALPIVAALAAAVGAAYLVWKNWDSIAPILQGLWGALQEAIGPSAINLFNALKEAVLDLWNSAFVQGIGSVLAVIARLSAASLQAFGSAIPGLLRGLGAVVGSVFDMIAASIRFVVAVLSGDWAGAWSAAGDFVGAFASGVRGLLSGLVGAVTGYVSSMVRSIDDLMGGRLTEIWNRVRDGVEAVKGYFRGMWDAVVGHSYVPDMVDGIAAQIARLDSVMVDKTRKATLATQEAFRKLADDVTPLLERLFPEAASLRQYREELDLLDRSLAANAITLEQHAAARARLARERGDQQASAAEQRRGGVTLSGGSDPLGGVADLGPQLERVADQANKALFMPLQRKTAETVEHFAGMARDVLGNLRGMVSAFKGGDILGGITGFFDMVVKVSQAVRGLSSPAPTVNVNGSYGGARAFGGPVVAGRRYRVGERGPEWFTPTQSGRIEANGGGGGGGGNVYHISGNLLTEEFWQQIQAMDDNAAQRGSMGGAQLSAQASERRARYSLGGRG